MVGFAGATAIEVSVGVLGAGAVGVDGLKQLPSSKATSTRITSKPRALTL